MVLDKNRAGARQQSCLVRVQIDVPEDSQAIITWTDLPVENISFPNQTPGTKRHGGFSFHSLYSLAERKALPEVDEEMQVVGHDHST